jgi:hypothetical protein
VVKIFALLSSHTARSAADIFLCIALDCEQSPKTSKESRARAHGHCGGLL